MAIGRVKWFNDAKGFGMIERGEGEEIFVHYTAIDSARDSSAVARRTLAPGESVRFDLYEGEKGLQARNVIRV